MTAKKPARFPGKNVIAASLLVLLAAVLALTYFTFREKPVAGSKQITISVVNSKAETTSYALKTDAQYLRQAMDEAEGLTYSGTEGAYGLMIDTVNGETADYSVDASYWSFNVNGEYCNYGVDEQPVNDGDAFSIVYTK
ncbi:MAG: DUF4430 domain-containing protein [Clostridia bacterium]|nr:DUF4430 domain-containing protein [Clostridia bacterium]